MSKLPKAALSLFNGLIILFLFSPLFSVHAQTDSQKILSDHTVLRIMKGGEKHLYTFQADAGKCLRFVIEQTGIDVKIAVKNPQDIAIKKVDRPSGSFGRETVTFIVPQTAAYTLEITTWESTAESGIYQIFYTEIDAPNEADLKRHQAENLTSEGEALRDLGSAEGKNKALVKFAEALEVWRELEDFYEQAVVYYGIGFTYQNLGKYSDAAIYYSRSMKLFSAVNNEFGQAVIHGALGSVQYVLGEFELSIYNYQKAIEIYEKMKWARGLGLAYSGLGVAYSLIDKDAEAIAALTYSLQWRKKANHKIGLARARFSLTRIYLEQKSYKKAEAELIQAEKTLTEINKTDEAEFFYFLGRLALETGDYEKAAESLETALVISQKTGDPLGTANVLFEQSRVNLKTKKLDTAQEKIRTALEIIEELRFSTADIRVRMKFSTTLQSFYQHYILLLMEMHRRDASKNYDRKALEISEKARARGLIDRLERRRIIQTNKITPALLEREQNLRDKLTAALALRNTGNSKEKNAEIQKVSNEFLEIESEINRSGKAISLSTLSVDEIQQNLDDDTILLEYALLEKESFLWFVSKNEFKSFQLPSAEKTEKMAREVYACISKPNFSCPAKIAEFSQILLSPVAQDIKNKRLIIVKEGFLQYISFAALFSPNPTLKTPKNKSTVAGYSNQFLIETNEIITLPSASLLSFLRRGTRANPRKTLAVFADPVYSEDDARIGKIKRENTFVSENSGVKLPRLFASHFEAQRISALLDEPDLLKKSGLQASRQAVFDANLQNFRIIHFAVHALVDDRQPELSSIALSFYDQEGVKINGFLRANEILSLNLNADLVVLSACQSGLGKQLKGEGIVSLAHSFFSAGAKSLIVSLWDVDDKVTAELMTRFYHKYLVENKKISTALQEAQIEIMRDKRWNSPYYWSAFTLQGDWH